MIALIAMIAGIASCSDRKGGMCRPPCGKSPTKDERARKILRILISTLKKKSAIFSGAGR